MAELVSVIMPLHNAELFAAAAIESALAQTYPSVEVVCVDDGSTDGTPEVLASFRDKIRLFHRHNKGGVSAARNLGISESSGEWVAFLDADDLWDPRKLEVQLAAATPDDDVLHCNSRTIDAAGNVTDHSRHKEGYIPPQALVDLLTGNRVLMLTVLVRRAALEAVGGFDASNRLPAQDWQLWLRLAATGHRFRYVNQVLASYRVHSGNTSRARDRVHRGEIYALKRTRQEYGRVFGEAERRAYRQTMFEFQFDLAWYRYSKGDYSGSASRFLRAALYKPSSLTAWAYAAATHVPFRNTVLPYLRRALRVIRGAANRSIPSGADRDLE